MLLVRNIRLPLSCPDPDAEAAAQALHILRVPAHKAEVSKFFFSSIIALLPFIPAACRPVSYISYMLFLPENSITIKVLNKKLQKYTNHR